MHQYNYQALTAQTYKYHSNHWSHKTEYEEVICSQPAVTFSAIAEGINHTGHCHDDEWYTIRKDVVPTNS